MSARGIAPEKSYPVVMRMALAIAGIVTSSTLGCSKELREVITKDGPKIEAQLARVRALREAARAAPRVTEDQVTIKSPPPRYTPLGFDAYDNVALEYLEDLDNLEEYGNIEDRIMGSGAFNVCASILKTHRQPYDPAIGGTPLAETGDGAETAFKRCEATRYLFVVRSLAYASPSTTATESTTCPKLETNETAASTPDAGPSDAGPSDAGPSDAGADAGRGRLGSVFVPKPPNANNKDAGADAGPVDAASAPATSAAASATSTTQSCLRFEGGYLSAEVLVFDLASNEQLGGFRFKTESSSRIDLNETTPDADFRTNLTTAFLQAAKRAIPSFLGAP